MVSLVEHGVLVVCASGGLSDMSEAVRFGDAAGSDDVRIVVMRPVTLLVLVPLSTLSTTTLPLVSLLVLTPLHRPA